MEITPNTIDHLARLARLSLSGEEREAMTARLERIVDRLAVLTEADGEDGEEAAPLCNVFREDRPVRPMDREELMKNAPACDGAYFLVPRAVE